MNVAHYTFLYVVLLTQNSALTIADANITLGHILYFAVKFSYFFLKITGQVLIPPNDLKFAYKEWCFSYILVQLVNNLIRIKCFI